jgi:hypothetical protein
MIQVTIFHWAPIVNAGSACYISCLPEIGDHKINGVNISPTSGIGNRTNMEVLKQEIKSKQNISKGIVLLLIFIKIDETAFIGLILVTKFQEQEMLSDTHASR